LVVDDHPMWRQSVAASLEEAGCPVAGTAGDGARALRVAAATRPEVVLLDLHLPDLSGAEVIRRLLAADPEVRIVVLSASGERRDGLAARAAGGPGYLVRSARSREMREGVGAAAAGRAVFTPGLAGLVLGEYRRLAAGGGQAGAAAGARSAAGGAVPTPQLTEREAGGLPPVAQGQTYPPIASLPRPSPRDGPDPVPQAPIQLQTPT